jgi:hypothetical protein
MSGSGVKTRWVMKKSCTVESDEILARKLLNV